MITARLIRLTVASDYDIFYIVSRCRWTQGVKCQNKALFKHLIWEVIKELHSLVAFMQEMQRHMTRTSSLFILSHPSLGREKLNSGVKNTCVTLVTVADHLLVAVILIT